MKQNKLIHEDEEHEVMLFPFCQTIGQTVGDFHLERNFNNFFCVRM